MYASDIHPVFNPRKLLLGMVFTGGVLLNAAPVSLDTAQKVAVHWMEQVNGKSYHVKQISGKSVTNLGVSSSSKSMYRIVQMDEGGWVIVSADDVARPVLGYGTSKIDPADLPPSMADWLAGMSQSIKKATRQKKGTKLGMSENNRDPEWNRLTQSSSLSPSQKSLGAPAKLGAYSIVDPLLWLGGNGESDGIQWNQVTMTSNHTKVDTYNHQTPIAPSRSAEGHMLTGCVATAMGQVLYYFSQKGVTVTGQGSHSYNLRTGTADNFQYDVGFVSATFGGYDWGSMTKVLDDTSIQPEVDAVSRLLFHLGVSVEMDYGYGTGTADTGNQDGGSLANYCASYNPQNGQCMDETEGTPSAYYALKTYFGFSEVKWAHKVNYSTQWNEMLDDSLDKGYPVLYGGVGTGGHAFVLDGYGSENLYHFNWGFGGKANGWYVLSALKPEGTSFDFSGNQQAIFFGGKALNLVSNNQTNTNGEDTGGGCTYNPHNNGIDLLMMLMVLLAALYPLGRKHLR